MGFTDADLENIFAIFDKRLKAKADASAGGGSGATKFTELIDTFASYAGLGLKTLRITAAENGVEAIASGLGEVSVKTDSYNAAVSDFDKTLVMNSASAKIFLLPHVDATNVGGVITFIKYGTGKMTVQANDSDIIRTPEASSAAGGTIANAADAYAVIMLRLITATEWIMISFTGTGWIIT